MSQSQGLILTHRFNVIRETKLFCPCAFASLSLGKRPTKGGLYDTWYLFKIHIFADGISW